jgi:hypothetical protein
LDGVAALEQPGRAVSSSGELARISQGVPD